MRYLPGQSNPFIPILSVRLCSLSRVLQTESDKRGTFILTDVPTGRYDLEAGGRGWKVFTIKGIEIENEKVKSVTVEMNDEGAKDSVCLLDGVAPCKPTEFTIQYGQPSSRKSAIILGKAINLESRGQKGLAKAKINISRSGETNPSHTAVSDKHGRFQIDLVPGVYDLIMSREGFQDVKIPDFLVPLENETSIELRTRRIGAIVLCQ